MASLEWEIRTHEGVTLVEAQVTSPYRTRVRLESALTPVLPPRTQGVPVEGWDETGYETTVEPEETVAVGYASPADPVEPPVELQEPEQGDRATETAPSARDLLRTLGDSRPPRDIVVPDENPPNKNDHTQKPTTRDHPHAMPGNESNTQRATEERPTKEPTERAARSDETPTPVQQPTPQQPEALQSWFDAVERRLDRAERLTEPDDATEARATIEEFGGIEPIRQLNSQLDADRKQLAALTKRQAVLSERLATTDIPVRTLERLE